MLTFTFHLHFAKIVCMRTTLGHMGPASTPNIIRQLITAICSITLIAALFDSILVHYVGFSLQFFLSLSAHTINSLYLWQPLTYLFLIQPAGGLTFGLIISLFFEMFILWMMGSNIAERFGSGSFAKLFFGSGIFAALLALPVYLSFPYMFPYAGPTASLFAVFVVWAFMHHDSQILLFFVIPVKAKWLLAGGLGASLLVFLSEEAGISLIMFFTGICFGYFYATLFKGFSSPYAFMKPVDRFVMNLNGFKWNKKKPKIFDIKTGEQVESDEEFLDRILTKISKSGKDSLTKKEKARLEEISLKKRK